MSKSLMFKFFFLLLAAGVTAVLVKIRKENEEAEIETINCRKNYYSDNFMM